MTSICRNLRELKRVNNEWIRGMNEGETKDLKEIDIFLCYFNDSEDPLFFIEEYQHSIIELECKRRDILYSWEEYIHMKRRAT